MADLAALVSEIEQTGREVASLAQRQFRTGFAYVQDDDWSKVAFNEPAPNMPRHLNSTTDATVLSVRLRRAPGPVPLHVTAIGIQDGRASAGVGWAGVGGGRGGVEGVEKGSQRAHQFGVCR
ncbi:MAG: hypothetical protein ACRCYU_02640 [Nocardioides sp.]